MTDAPDAIALSTLANDECAGQIILRAAIYIGAVHVPLWSDSASGPAPRLDGDFGASLLNLCCRASAALVDLLVNPNERDAEDDADFLAGAALRHMYSMLPGGIAEAARLLERAYEISPRGRYLARRAQLAAIEYVESAGERLSELAEQSDELCYKAIAAEGTNSNVLAAVANARLVLDDDRVAAAELSKLAVQVNSANPPAWDAWSYALVSIGDHKRAYRAAQTAQTLSRDTHFRYSTEF